MTIKAALYYKTKKPVAKLPYWHNKFTLSKPQ